MWTPFAIDSKGGEMKTKGEMQTKGEYAHGGARVVVINDKGADC